MGAPYCQVCESQILKLGQPSYARWVGPNGKAYCSMHFVQRFGHGEKLVKINGYEPPKQVKPPQPKEAKPRTEPRRKSETVEA